MQAPRARPAPDPEHVPADDSEIPPWQADYETCPVCHRPVRRERLTRHMELLHAGAQLTEEESPAEPEVQAAPGGLRGLLARLFGRRAD